jgi:hypothetical protein
MLAQPQGVLVCIVFHMWRHAQLLLAGLASRAACCQGMSAETFAGLLCMIHMDSLVSWDHTMTAIHVYSGQRAHLFSALMATALM